nr:PREDICTED: uncharacterized protein LOC109038004 [Bemisia tabaci]
MQFFRGLCLISLVFVPISVVGNDYFLGVDGGSKNLGVIGRTFYNADADHDQNLREIRAHRQRKSLFSRPSFLGGSTTRKIDPSTKDWQENVNSFSAEISNSRGISAPPHEAEYSVYPQSINLESNSLSERNEKPHSKVQESLSNILGSLQKREANSPIAHAHFFERGISSTISNSPQSGTSEAPVLGNQEAASNVSSDDSDEPDAHGSTYHRIKVAPQEGPTKGRNGANLLDAKIRDLTNQVNAISNPRSGLVHDKSDLELLNEVIDRAGKTSSSGKRIRSLEKGALHESSQNAERTDFHKRISTKETRSKDEISLDSDLERMIQDAAERIGLWVNQNFDTARKITKSKLKADSTGKEHTKAFSEETTDKVAKSLSAEIPSRRRKILDAEAKRAALKILIHAATARPESEASSDLEVEIEEPPKHKKGSGKLSISEVKKVRTTTLPPCMTARSSECTRWKTTPRKTATTAKCTTIEPKVAEDCTKPSSPAPKATCKPCADAATHKTRASSGRPKKVPTTTEPCDASDRLLKILNGTLRTDNFSRPDQSSLAELMRVLLTELVSNSSRHAEIPSGKPDDTALVNKSTTECANPVLDSSKLKNLTPDHALKNTNSRLLNNFVNFATLEAARRRGATERQSAAQDKEPIVNGRESTPQNKEAASQDRQAVAQDKQHAVQDRQSASKTGESTVSPLRALTVLLDLMRGQSGDPDSSDHLRLQSLGENGPVALNVFIKAAIIPEFKNVSVANGKVRSAERANIQAGHPRNTQKGAEMTPTLASPRSRYTDNTLNNLLKSIIVKARFERPAEPEMLQVPTERQRR